MDTPEVKSPRKNNALTQARAGRLLAWIDGRKETALSLPSHAVAEIATDTLGFTITSSNVLHAMKGLGIARQKPERPQSAAACRCEQMAGVMLKLLSYWPPTVGDIETARAELRKIAAKPAKVVEPYLFAPGPCAAEREKSA